MSEFLISTWSILLTAGVGYLVRNSRQNKKNRIKERGEMQKKQFAIEEALCAILHERILKRCEQLLIIGSVTMEDLRELDYLYRPYRALGGNGTAENAYKKVQKLKIVERYEEN